MAKQSKQPERFDKFPVVVVEWIDSCEPAPNAEVEMSEIPEPQRIVQAGWLVNDTKDAISVAGAFKPMLRTMDYVITIPRCAVLAIHRL